MATIRDKMEYLSEITSYKDYFKLSKRYGNISFDLVSARAYQYINLRAVIGKKLNKEKISRAEMAQAIGIKQSSFCDWMSGRRPLPYKYLERLLGLLYLDSDFVDAMKSREKQLSDN